MTTITIQLANLIHNFSASMVDVIFDTEDEDERSDLREGYFRDLRGLTSNKIKEVSTTIRRLFETGYTAQLITGIDFESLESTQANKEEYSITIKNNKETICILCQNEVFW